MRGGYQMIDLKNKSLSTTEVEIPGVYEAIEGNYRKPILLHNINLGGTEKADAYVDFTLSSTTYSATVYGGTIAITEDDEVTYTPAE